MTIKKLEEYNSIVGFLGGMLATSPITAIHFDGVTLTVSTAEWTETVPADVLSSAFQEINDIFGRNKKCTH